MPMINVQELIPFLVRNNLTIKEYLVLHLKYLKRNKLLKKYKDAFNEGKKNILTLDSKQKLIDLGFLVKDDTREGEFYLLGKDFLDIYIDEYTAGNEFWDKYLAFININGKNAPLKATDKFGFRKLYFGIIQANRHEHNKIIKDLIYGIENGYVKCKITDFVKGEMWADIRKLRLGQTSKQQIIQKADRHDF